MRSFEMRMSAKCEARGRVSRQLAALAPQESQNFADARSCAPQSAQNFFFSMSAPQSVQNFATGVGTWHTGHSIIASCDTWVGPVGITGTAIVDSMGETLDAGFGITVAIGMRTVPDFPLTAPLEYGGDEGEGGEDGDAGDAGAEGDALSGGFDVTPSI